MSLRLHHLDKNPTWQREADTLQYARPFASRI